MMIAMDESVAARYAQVAGVVGEIAQRLDDEVEKLGFDPVAVSLYPPEEAVYRLDRDPYSGAESLVGEWRDEHGIKLGELLFHADGSFFVEQDVARPHPSRRQWFVEAVNAWGRDGQIKAEARLLPMPE